MVGQINHHLYRKRGFYYFCRRVPKALLAHYAKPRIVLALKTKQYRDALRQSQIISKRLDDQWFHMQLDAIGLDNIQSKLFQSVKPSAPLMSEATSFYYRYPSHQPDRASMAEAKDILKHQICSLSRCIPMGSRADQGSGDRVCLPKILQHAKVQR